MDTITTWIGTIDASVVAKITTLQSQVATLQAQLAAATATIATSVQTADVVTALSAENDKINAM